MSKPNSNKSSKNNKTSNGKGLNSSNPGRPRPTIAKAGYTQNRRRYKNGGDWCY